MNTLPGSPVPWVTGRCWLWCERTGVPVKWLGPVHSGGISAGMYACEPCITKLAHMVYQDHLHRERPVR